MRTSRLFGATVVALGGALVASAAPPADTNPAPNVPSQVKSNVDKATSNAQKSVDARKDAPASGSANANASGGANVAAQAPRTNASGSVSGSAATGAAVQAAPNTAAPSAAAAQTGANVQGRANVGGANVQAGANANTQGGANVQRGTAAQGRVNAQGNVGASTSTAPNAAAGANAAVAPNAAAPNVAAPAAAAGVNATVAPNAAAPAAGAATATVQGQTAAGLNAQAGTSTLANVARISQAIGLGFAQGANGLTLSTISPNSPFSSVGFLPGDQIVSFGGQTFASPTAFTQYLSGVPVGQRIPVVVMRNGAQQTMYWTPNQQFAQLLPPAPRGNIIAVQLPMMPLDNLGIQLDRNIPNAAIVAQVAPGSPAQQAGVLAGDQIVALNDREIHSPNEFLATLNQLPADAPINLSLSRNVQQNVQVEPSNPIPVTAGRPIIPAQTNPATRPARRILRRNN